jgi:hypothetical protein
MIGAGRRKTGGQAQREELGLAADFTDGDNNS